MQKGQGATRRENGRGRECFRAGGRLRGAFWKEGGGDDADKTVGRCRAGGAVGAIWGRFESGQGFKTKKQLETS